MFYKYEEEKDTSLHIWKLEHLDMNVTINANGNIVFKAQKIILMNNCFCDCKFGWNYEIIIGV